MRPKTFVYFVLF